MWKGKREVKLTHTKSIRELGIEIKEVLGVTGQELSSRQGHLSGVACSGHASLHEHCPDVPLPHAQLHFHTQLDGLQGRGSVSAGEIPSYAQKGSSFFFRKRLTRLNKEDERHGRALPGATLG